MLSRALPLFRILLVLLVIGLVILAGAFVRLAVVGTSPKVPRTELERAQFAAEEAVKADPNNPAARLKLAAAYLERKNYAAALEQANAANRLKPKDPTVFYIKGLAESAKGDNNGAVTDLTQAVALKGQMDTFYSDAYVALARAQAKLGKSKEAIASMGQAIDLNPENATLIFERGQMHEQDQNWILALDDYSQALQYVPNYSPAQEAFSRVSTAHPEALAKLRKDFQNDPANAMPGVTPFNPGSAGATSTPAQGSTSATRTTKK